MQGLGNSGRLDGQHGSAGLKQRTQGLLLGADWSIDHAWRIGVVGGKSGSDLSAKRFKGELDSWHLGAYAVRQDGPLALRLGALYSSHRGQEQTRGRFRLARLSRAAQGQVQGPQPERFSPNWAISWTRAGLRVEPFAGLGFQRYQRDRFQEKGGYGALNVGTQTQQNLSSTFGLRLAHDFALDNQMILKPHLSSQLETPVWQCRQPRAPVLRR